ncbi:hypothetical protein NDU88_001725 [Pleurodeles waltl]|uniref:Uncharacterized protein n=1 Tax=Pleurodeles waltl TaxID=8319 RepID=A0AAV7RC26_PLEWA|nr:hypothetical protein NDU88_001725 [Pleurodeles waltl]
MIPFAVLLESQVDSVLLTRVGGVTLVLGGSVGASAPSSSDGRARGRRTSYHWFSLGGGERPPLLPRVGARGEGGPVTTGSHWAVWCVRPFFLGWAREGKAGQLPLVLAGRGGRPRTLLQLLSSGVQVTPGTPQAVVSPLLLLGYREASMSVCPPPLHPAGDGGGAPPGNVQINISLDARQKEVTAGVRLRGDGKVCEAVDMGSPQLSVE